MNSYDTRRFEMLARVREFGDAHRELFPAGSRCADLMTTVEAAVEEISAQFTAQQAGSGVARTGASNRAALRERVRERLNAMRRSAREIAIELPGVDGQFRFPRSNGDQALIGAARSFVERAGPLRPQFSRQMLDADFFAALEFDVEAFEQALSDQRRGRDTRTTATVAIAGAIDRGAKSVRSLDTLILNRYGGEQTVLAAWRSARRVHSANVRGAGAGEQLQKQPKSAS